MAVVGEAHIIVRALTDKVAGDIQRGFSGTGSAGRKAGENMGQAFTRGFNKNASANIFTKFADGLSAMVPNAEAAYQSMRKLSMRGIEFGTAIAVIIGGLSSLISGLVSLGGAALGAGASLAVLGNVFGALGLAMISARLALSGVGKALAALNKSASGGSNSAAILQAQAAAAERVADAERNLATVIENNRESLVQANNDVRDSQLELNKAIVKGQEEIQQLGFDAEDAALSESKAALELDKARETLARTQDLPPNSRARKEAELAFKEAELNLRKAKDKSADLNKEQDRLARTGVNGTQAVISANQRLAQAQANKDKVIRDGLRSQANAEAELAKAKAAAATAGQDAGGGGADPFAGLNEAQIRFVQFLASLKPQFDALKASLSAALLPPLQEAITTLMTGAFPVVQQGLTLIAGATGQAAKSFANAVVEATNLKNLGTLFESSARIIESLGRSAGSVWGILMSVLSAVAPMAERFVGFVETALGKFDAYLKSNEGKTAMLDFFARVEENAKLVGEILGNVFGGLGAIIQANTGPGTGGYMLLEWLRDATQGFSEMGKGANGEKLKEFFKGVADNVIIIMGAIGSLLGELIKLGDNKAIGETFAALEKGAPAVGEILTKLVEAGPAMGELVAQVVEITNALTDTQTAQVFFDVLKNAAKIVADVLKSDLAQEILAVTGIFFGFSLAIQRIWTIASGPIGLLISGFKNIGTAITILQGIFNGYYLKKTAWWIKDVAETIYLKTLYAIDMVKAVGAYIAQGAILIAQQTRKVAALVAEKVALMASVAWMGIVTAAQWAWNAAVSANPIGLIIIAIAALIAGLVLLIMNWDTVVKFITDTWQGFVDWITPGLEAFGAFFTGMWQAIGTFVSDVWNNIVTFVTGAWNALWGFIGPAIDAFFGWWNGLWSAVGQFISDTWNNIVNFFVTGWQNVWTFILSAIVAYYSWWFGIFASVGQFIADTWNNIVKFFMDGWNAVWNWLSPVIDGFVTWWNGIFSAVGKFISDTWNNIVKFFKDGWNIVYSWIKNQLDIFVRTWSGIFTGIGNFISDVWTNIMKFFKDGWNGVVSWITGAIKTFQTGWQNTWTNIGNFVGDVFTNIVNSVKAPINWIIDMINGIIGSINQLRIQIPDWVPLVGGKTLSFNIAKIPRLAMGGVVSPSRGGTLAQIAEAGRPERVEPLDQNGMSKRDKYMIDLIKQGTGTINITVNPSAGMDESELAAAISREISFQMRRGAVA